jgi:ABC-2 type transport system permease protein
MSQTLHNPVWVAVGLTQPIFFLLLFGPLLKPMTTAQGFPSDGAFNVFVPGLLFQLVLFGTAFAGFNLIGELRAGVIERLQVTPLSRTALLLGRAGRDVTILLVQCVLLIALAIPLGLHLDAGGAVIALLFVVLLGIGLSCLSYALGMIMKTEDAFAPLVNFVTMPLLLLSGILLPMSLAPRWLQDLSDANPLRQVVDGARAVFNGHTGDASVWRGLAVAIAITVVAVTFGARRFRRAAA